MAASGCLGAVFIQEKVFVLFQKSDCLLERKRESRADLSSD